DPALTHPHQWVRTSYRAIQNLLIVDSLRELAPARPDACRWRQRFHFARDRSTLPMADPEKTMASQAAESGDAMHNHMWHVGVGKHTHDRLSGAAWNATLNWRQAVQLRPVFLRVLQAMPGHFPQSRMILGQDEWTPTRSERFAISGQHSFANTF